MRKLVDCRTSRNPAVSMPRIAALLAVLLAGTALAGESGGDQRDPGPEQAHASPDDVEEVVVIGDAPAPGKAPSMEQLLAAYAARRTGADLYRRGRYAEAFPHLLTAAKRGFKFAQARVGFLYQQGLGTPQDPEAAIGWLGIASKSETMPEIRNHFNALWRKIPDVYRPRLEQVIDDFEAKYGSRVNRVVCDSSHKAGTFTKHLTCRFMDEHLYNQTGETMSEVTAFEVAPVGG